MEAGHSLSALGRAGALRIWRAEICFLSSCFVDSRYVVEPDLSLDCRAEYLHMDRAGSGWSVDVRAGAAMARPPRRHLCSIALYCQPVSPGDCLLAQRIRRTPGQLPGAALAAVRAEGRGRGPARDCASRFGARGGGAPQCPGRRHASLFDGVASGVLCVAATLAADPAGGG